MAYFPCSFWQFAVSADYFVKPFELEALLIISAASEGLWLGQ